MTTDTDTKFETTYFWKGTRFPITLYQSHGEMMKEAKNMIATGLLAGDSMKKQAEDYKKQLNTIEKALWKHNGNFTEENLTKIAEGLGLPLWRLHCVWCLNICALLIMKEIENNENYGSLQYMKKNGGLIIIE